MTTYNANTTFYLRWQSNDGQSSWTGSNEASFADKHPLDDWQLRSARTTLYLSSNAEPVFARILDTGSNTIYGAKLNKQTSGCNLTFAPSGPLELEAGLLISDDPKIQIKSGGTTTPCTWTWNGSTWSYQIGGGSEMTHVGDPLITLYSTRGEAVPVTIIDKTHTANRFALYSDASSLASTPLPTGTSVNYIETYELVPGSGVVSIQVAPNEAVYTLNLFVNRATRLALAPSGT